MLNHSQEFLPCLFVRFVENHDRVKRHGCLQMEIVPREAGFGAFVTVTRLEQFCSDRSGRRLKQALSRFQVLIFRSLTTELEPFQRLAQALGERVRHDFVPGLVLDPCIHEIYKAPDHVQNFGGRWHSDGAYLASPPSAVLLQALEVPEMGGDTIWSCQLTAYAALPREMKEALYRCRILHSASSVFGRFPGAEKNDAKMATDHPVFRWIPDREELALYHSGHCAQKILGVPAHKSVAYLDALFEAATRSRQYRHTWRPGDIILWDNRTTMHRALNDYSGSARRMRRTLIGGEIPLAPP